MVEKGTSERDPESELLCFSDLEVTQQVLCPQVSSSFKAKQQQEPRIIVSFETRLWNRMFESWRIPFPYAGYKTYALIT